MKTNFYIFIFLLFSITNSNAQNNEISIIIESNVAVCLISNQENKEAVNGKNALVNGLKETILIDSDTLKQIVARINSDIRIYFNRK